MNLEADLGQVGTKMSSDPACSPSTLPYTFQCQHVLRTPSSSAPVVLAAHPKPRFTSKLFAPKPHVDLPDTMCTLMENCRPSFLTAPASTGRRRVLAAGQPSVTAKKWRVPERPPPPRGVPGASPNASDAHPNVSDAAGHVAELTWRLSDAQRQVEERGACQPGRRRTPQYPQCSPPSEEDPACRSASVSSDELAPAHLSVPTQTARHSVQPPPRSCRSSGAQTRRRTYEWVRKQETMCPPSLPSRPLSASLVGFRPSSTTPITKILRNSFDPPDAPPLPYFNSRARASLVATPGTASGDALVAAPEAKGQRVVTPAFLTDGSTSGRPLTAQTVASTVGVAAEPLRVPLADERGCSLWLGQVLREPIRSYELMRTITTPEVPPQPFTGTGEPASVARAHLVHSQQQFDHERVVMQNELELFFDYRSRCRTLVAYRAAERESAACPKAPPFSALGEARVDDADLAGTVREALLPFFQEEEHRRASCQRSQSTSLKNMRGKQTLKSVWTNQVSDMAFEEHVNSVCDALQNFRITFPAAALSVDAMEKLRADVIHLIRHPAKMRRLRLLTSAELSRYLIAHHYPNDSHTLKPTGTTPDDIADAMPSQAEAAFVRHAFTVLRGA